jgi:hypothetical protein
MDVCDWCFLFLVAAVFVASSRKVRERAGLVE